MRVRVSYQGRVQGVGFRATAADIASAFDVSGWVRNEPDGTVLLEVQGPPDQTRRFLDALRQRMGPLIRSADEAIVPDAPGESGFLIRRW
jgi:acylphosphatase